MDATKSQCAKQLKELLKQDQDDFSMQNYLIERSYMFKNCSTHRIYSTKNLKWSMKYDLHKIRKSLLHATGVLRSTLHKFISTDDEHYRKATQQKDEVFSKRFGMCHDFSDIEVEDKVFTCENHSSSIEDMFQTFTLHNLRRPEVDTGTNPYWISSKDNQQQYYNRGLEWKEPLSNTVRSPDAPVTPLQTLSSRDPLFISYLRKLLLNSNILKCNRARRKKVKGIGETASLCRRNRELYQNEGKSVPMKEVCEYVHFNLLEKHCREVRTITQMVHNEPCVVSEEWKTFQIVSWKILADIGDSIMDDIVMEIIDLF